MTALEAGALVVGFGGNVGEDAAIIARFTHARAALAELGAVRSAALYRSAPVGPPQPAYLNTAVRVRIAGPSPEPRELVETLLELERLLGRDRHTEVHWGPRPIDLDVLVWGTRALHHRGPPALIVPHPRLAERRFALQPLADVVGGAAELPGTPVTLASALAAVADQQIERIADTW